MRKQINEARREGKCGGTRRRHKKVGCKTYPEVRFLSTWPTGTPGAVGCCSGLMPSSDQVRGSHLQRVSVRASLQQGESKNRKSGCWNTVLRVVCAPAT